MKMQLLKKATLGWLASSQHDGKPAVTVPQYNSSELGTGILHVGVGGFFRAFEASYLDELFNQDFETNQAWGIVGAGVTNGRYSERKKMLEQQEMLYTLCQRDGEGSSARVIGSIVELLPYDEKFGPVMERLLDPEVKIVSTCITEGGYFLEPSSGTLDVGNVQIQHDIASPDEPQTIIGVIVNALRKRKEAGIDPFTILCLDNIPENGSTVKASFRGLATAQDAELGQWIDENVCFPNSMVDRITPKTGKKEIDYLQETYGFKDEDPVFCEPFIQWVLEDKFVNNERPDFDKVGVQFVPDVHPYERAKLRVLNGGHASLCYGAALLGLEYVHEAMQHPTIGPFLDCLERTEIVPCVGPLPSSKRSRIRRWVTRKKDTSVVSYWETIQKRFENPTINDRIDRNCEDGSDRQPKFIIPTIQDAIQQNGKLDGLALVSALWCRFCQVRPFPPSDTKWDTLAKAAAQAESDPSAWLAMEEIYGNAGRDKRFADAFAAALKKIQTDGVEAAMEKYILESGGVLDKENDASSSVMNA